MQKNSKSTSDWQNSGQENNDVMKANADYDEGNKTVGLSKFVLLDNDA